jgi:hypothetical protein
MRDDWDKLSDEDWCAEERFHEVTAAIVGLVVLGLFVAVIVVAGILSLSVNGR